MDVPAEERVAHIERVLRESFAPSVLEVKDESFRHRGHAGAKSGGGHFNVRIVARAFTGRSRLARHRLVHDALEAELKQAIHALSLTAMSPEEVERS